MLLRINFYSLSRPLTFFKSFNTDGLVTEKAFRPVENLTPDISEGSFVGDVQLA